MTGILRSLAVAVLAAALHHPAALAAEPQRPVTLTGKMACALCLLKLKDATSCATVLVVAEAGREVVYALADGPVTRAHDMAACEKAVRVKVTGTVNAAGGAGARRVITPTRIERT